MIFLHSDWLRSTVSEVIVLMNISNSKVCLRDRSLFVPQGGTEEKLKKVYIYKKITQPLWVFKFFLPNL